MINAQTWCAVKLVALAKKLRSAPKTDPMIPSSDPTAFSARRFKASNKCFNLSLTHSMSLFLYFGGAALLPPPPPTSARTTVEIIPKNEVKIKRRRIHCSRKKILNFSRIEVLLPNILVIVFLILETWLCNSFLFIEHVLTPEHILKLCLSQKILAYQWQY